MDYSTVYYELFYRLIVQVFEGLRWCGGGWLGLPVVLGVHGVVVLVVLEVLVVLVAVCLSVSALLTIREHLAVTYVCMYV